MKDIKNMEEFVEENRVFSNQIQSKTEYTNKTEASHEKLHLYGDCGELATNSEAKSAEIRHIHNFIKTVNIRIVKVGNREILQQLNQCEYCLEYHWVDVQVVDRPAGREYE